MIDRPPGGLARRQSDALSSLSGGRQRRFRRLDKDYRSLPERAGQDNPTRAAASCSVMGGRSVGAGAANRQSHLQYARSTRGGDRSRHDTGGTNAQRWLRLLRHVLVQSFSRRTAGQWKLQPGNSEPLRDPRSGHPGPVLYLLCKSPLPPTRPRPRPNRAGIRLPRHWPMGKGGREEWQPSPDTEEIRQHLLDIVRLPEEHADEGYHFYTRPAHIETLTQLLE